MKEDDGGMKGSRVRRGRMQERRKEKDERGKR